MRELLAFTMSGYPKAVWATLHPEDKEAFYEYADRILIDFVVTPK